MTNKFLRSVSSVCHSQFYLHFLLATFTFSWSLLLNLDFIHRIFSSKLYCPARQLLSLIPHGVYTALSLLELNYGFLRILCSLLCVKVPPLLAEVLEQAFWVFQTLFVDQIPQMLTCYPPHCSTHVAGFSPLRHTILYNGILCHLVFL